MTNSDSQISEVIALNPSFTMFSSKINVRVLFKRIFICPENMDTPLSGQCFSLNRPEITKALMVDLS